MKTTNGKDNRLIKKIKGKTYYEWEGEQERVEQTLRHKAYDWPYDNEDRRMEWPTKGKRRSIHNRKHAALNQVLYEIFMIIQLEVPSMSAKSVKEWTVWCRYHITLGIDGFWGEKSNREEHMRLMNRFLGALMERYEELYDDMFLNAQKNAGENREWRNKDHLWDVPKFIQVNAGN